MADFLENIAEMDLPEVLGDLYAPTVSCVVVGWALISAGFLAEMVSDVVTVLFGGEKK